MKVGDGSKPFSLPDGLPAKATRVAEQGSESLAGGTLLRGDGSVKVDRFEKAVPPAFAALLGAGSESTAGVAVAKDTAGGAVAAAGAALLRGLGNQLGRAESDTRALMRRVDGPRLGDASVEGAARGAGDLGKALLDGLAAAADALAKAQDMVAAESTLESMIGHAGRLLRHDTARDVEALSRGLESLRSTAAGQGKAVVEAGLSVAQWTARNDVAAGQQALDDLKQALAGVDSQLRVILGEIEELRAGEAGEQEAAESDPGDPLAAVAQSVSDAHAAIHDLLDL